jgi:membrane protein implicated in regulation of membrane protease activity
MINKFFKILSKWPSSKALIVACICCLIGLALMVAAILWPIPIVVVIGMSVAQGGVILAILLFVLSVAAEYRRDTGLSPKSEKV